MLYNNLSTYLREKYGKRMKKICIDGGFTCPNRDGKCGTGGCIFCGERGSGEHIDRNLTIGEQVKAALNEANADELFIAYFQNFTNTYADTQTLKERYDSALVDDRIKILSIGTRPDCIDEGVAKLISSYSTKYEVWVELGLQTASDETAKTINRGYTRKEFEKAMDILSYYGIKVIVHLIIGLPGESRDEAVKSARYLSKFNLFGIKIHSLYVMDGTELADMYAKNLYTPPTLPEYADIASDVIAEISEDVILHRITGDCPKDRLIAPEWNKGKSEIIAEINSALERKGYRQGSLAPSIIKAANELTKLGYSFSKRASNVCFIFDTGTLSLGESTSFIALTSDEDGSTLIEDMCETHDAVWPCISEEHIREIAARHNISVKDGKYLRLYTKYDGEDSLKRFIFCLKDIESSL